jgi:cystathionine beta-lyase
LCNPHNPTGRAFDRAELTAMAARCLANDIVICSDEIHCELTLGDATHIPIATLSPAIAQQTITLMSPSKTFNIPGLGFCVAIIQNPELRAQYVAAMQGLVASPQIFGYTGALAAYQHGDEWLREVLQYYQANREYALGFIRQYMPQLIPNHAEATYLLWIDCRQANLPTNPKEFFLSHANVALGDGSAFGAAGEGYIRLTLATQRSVLAQALESMYRALQPYS